MIKLQLLTLFGQVLFPPILFSSYHLFLFNLSRIKFHLLRVTTYSVYRDSARRLCAVSADLDAVMASPSDNEMEYLSPSFDPTALTVPRLRAILVSHDISYPASAKKSQLIDLFDRELVPRSRKILAARSRTKRTSRGITNMPSSQESAAGGNEGAEGDDKSSMPPPLLPPTSRSRSRKSHETVREDTAVEASSNEVSSGRRKKHARPSDTETDMETPARSLGRKSRRSEATPTVTMKGPEASMARPPLGESVFSHENPFQSGSSPLAQTENRRRSAGASSERRKTASSRRRTEGVTQTGTTRIKQEDGIVVPSAKKFEIPLKRMANSKFDAEGDDGVEAGEEFTPQEQLELMKARAANGERDVLPPRKKRLTRKSSVVPKSAPWAILMTFFMGYAIWWRQEKLRVGYCGVARPSAVLSHSQIPSWAEILQPQCESCPQHATCYESLETRCDQDFVLKPHPLALGGLVPLPPSCEPDGEKARRVKVVADRAMEELRERRAKWECGTLIDEQGKPQPAVEIEEASLKKEVAKKRRRNMSEREFEDLWKSALGELMGRDEVVHSSNE